MAKDKVKVEFKVLKQSAEVGGKYYGIIDNSNPVNPTLTMQQIIDYKKLHNWSASQLGALVEDVLQGAAELVARDGQPRNLSSLLKFEARIKGTFANPEAAVTSQNVYVSPRMLKDIKASLDKGDFEFSNTNDSTDPRISQAAIDYDGWQTWSIAETFRAAMEGMPVYPNGNLVISGSRLCPNGWTGDCGLAVKVLRAGAYLCNLDRKSEESGGATYVKGMFAPPASVAALNAFEIPRLTEETSDIANNAWTPTSTPDSGYKYVPAAGDEIVFEFTRDLSSGEAVTAVKKVALTA